MKKEIVDGQPQKNKQKVNANVAEPLNNASPERPGCRECGLYKSQSRFMRPSIPEGYTRKALFVGGPFNNACTHLLHKLCKKAGFTPEDVVIAPVVRCQPVSGKAPTMAQIRACRPFILQIIYKFRPSVVIGFGSSALRILRNKGDSNITKNRGKEIKI